MPVDCRRRVWGVGELQAWIEEDLNSRATCWLGVVLLLSEGMDLGYSLLLIENIGATALECSGLLVLYVFWKGILVELVGFAHQNP